MTEQPLRVAFDNSLTGRNRTGSGVYVSELLSRLNSHPELKLHVFSGPNWSNGHAGPVVKGLRSAGRLFWAQCYLPFSLHRSRFDLLHSPAFILPAVCPCPAVVTVLDVVVDLYPGDFNRKWQAYVKALMPRAMRTASAVICISECTKRDLIRLYDVSERKIHVVHLGLDHQRFHPRQKLDVAWARSIGLNRDYILHVGEFAPRKNIPSLLRAVAQLRRQGKFDRLQLVLAGPETPGTSGGIEIRNTIKDLELHDSVVLTGHVPKDKLPGLYAQARLLVMPSLYEGFGLPVIEGMAAGTPVVASNSSSIPEVAGEAAILVPPKDEVALAGAIADVLGNVEIAEELRKKGLARAGQFTWQRTAQETFQVYRSVSSS